MSDSEYRRSEARSFLIIVWLASFALGGTWGQVLGAGS